MAPHSSTLAWKIPWTEEPGRLQSMGSLKVRHDWATSLSLFTVMHWRKWQPVPVFLPGESQGRRSLMGCRLWGHTESDTTEATQQQLLECGEQRTSNSQLYYDLFQLQRTVSLEVETPWEVHTRNIRRLGYKCTVILAQNKTTMTDNSCCVPPPAGLPCLCKTYIRLKLSSSVQFWFSSFPTNGDF